MKKGVILYLTDGKEAFEDRDWPKLSSLRATLGASAVWLAASEEEIAYAWWRLLVRGMHQVFCMTAKYDPGGRSIEPYGEPLRLCG